MANEIQVGPGGIDGSFSLLFYYPIPAQVRIEQRDDTGAVTGSPVVPTPSSELPSWAKLTAAETTALDNGTALFHVFEMAQGNGETEAAFAARVKARYAELGNGSGIILATYEARFRHLNKRITP